MEYTIKNTEINGDTTITTVEYNIEGTIVTVNVAHFMATPESIELGINNRYYTEMYKLFPDRMPPAPVYEPTEEELSALEKAIQETKNYSEDGTE